MRDNHGRTSKRCGLCGIDKPIEDYWVSRYRSSGYHSQCRECCSAYRKALYSNPDAKARLKVSEIKSKRKSRYGITEDVYQSLLASQDGVCAICGKSPSGSRNTKFLHVDHDHTTGQIRGLLCNRCNVAIASFGDTIEGLMKAVRYLERFPP